MGRFSVAACAAAFFPIAICSDALAQTCQNCAAREVARLDVTAAVDAAVAFVVATMRKLTPAYQVTIAEGESSAPQALPHLPGYAATFAGDETHAGVELPEFQRRYAWQLTYRDEGLGAVSRSSHERASGTDVALDDSWVFGLRFELDYGWKR
jgi:hypothetical protein